jgi:hypothetical protein
VRRLALDRHRGAGDPTVQAVPSSRVQRTRRASLPRWWGLERPVRLGRLLEREGPGDVDLERAGLDQVVELRGRLRAAGAVSGHHVLGATVHDGIPTQPPRQRDTVIARGHREHARPRPRGELHRHVADTATGPEDHHGDAILRA